MDMHLCTEVLISCYHLAGMFDPLAPGKPRALGEVQPRPPRQTGELGSCPQQLSTPFPRPLTSQSRLPRSHWISMGRLGICR